MEHPVSYRSIASYSLTATESGSVKMQTYPPQKLQAFNRRKSARGDSVSWRGVQNPEQIAK